MGHTTRSAPNNATSYDLIEPARVSSIRVLLYYMTYYYILDTRRSDSFVLWPTTYTRIKHGRTYRDIIHYYDYYYYYIETPGHMCSVLLPPNLCSSFS